METLGIHTRVLTLAVGNSLSRSGTASRPVADWPIVTPPVGDADISRVDLDYRSLVGSIAVCRAAAYTVTVLTERVASSDWSGGLWTPSGSLPLCWLARCTIYRLATVIIAVLDSRHWPGASPAFPLSDIQYVRQQQYMHIPTEVLVIYEN